MNQITNSTSTTEPFNKTGAFLSGILAGLAGGLLVLAGWFLYTTTSLPAQLALFLGITEKTPWYLSRSAGTVAYLLLSGSTIWGLLLSSKLIKETVPAMLSLTMHNVLSWLAITFTTLHALVLLFDTYYTYTLADLTVPFIGPYRPGWVGLGILSLYLMLFIAVSFQFRKQLGQTWWRRLHYLSFVFYLLATVHGVMAGTDSAKMGMQLIYWGSGLLVLFLTNYRLLVKSK